MNVEAGEPIDAAGVYSGTGIHEAVTVNAALEALFDAEYYAAYPDVAAAVGNDEGALLQHYLSYGITEGRRASAYFNALTYKTENADLEAAFGNDWNAYADHYIACGVSEGRNAGGERAITDAEYAAGRLYLYAPPCFFVYFADMPADLRFCA